MLRNIPALMDRGKPVSIIFTQEKGEETDFLYCELVQRARYGESFLIKNQKCSVGAYVLRDTDISPVDYYFESGRYRDRNAAKKTVLGLSRVQKRYETIKIIPYSGENFDILMLFLKPERAMRLVQAYAYKNGIPVEIRTAGTASVCSECTAYPLTGELAISLGCKGSRKHSRYSDNEVIVGLPFELAEDIEIALEKIPETFS